VLFDAMSENDRKTYKGLVKQAKDQQLAAKAARSGLVLAGASNDGKPLG